MSEEKDYDYVVECDPDGEVDHEDLPEEYQDAENWVFRQYGQTITHQGRSMRMEATSQNDHLEVTEDYWEAEVKLFGEEKDLVKVEIPDGYKMDPESGDIEEDDSE